MVTSFLSPPASVRCRLIYRSETSWDLLSNDSLLQLATKSAENNASKGITGLLLLSGENFLQVLEGPPEHVNSLYQTITLDQRHKNVTLLSYEQVDQLYFEEWSMHVVDLHDLPLPQRDFLRAKYPEEHGYIRIPDDDRTAFSLLFDAKVISPSESERA